ncbi:hypothetical protein V490_09374 [Pseudogymnoascus sp. VKM F-3557]|nr:hypothetical protein V490_09374 [Pseudogymnoascus sp. VKM F-3557]
MGEVNPWRYSPSPAAAMIFFILFTITTFWHIIIMFRRHVWYFSVLAIGGGLEIAGHITRYLASKDTTNLVLFVIQTLCILVAPALFAASIYMVLGRLITLVRAEAFSPIRPTWLTKIFVLGDLLSFLIQIMGSGMLSKNFNLGKTIILIGLIAQIICFGLFVLVAVLVSRRLAQNPTPMAKLLDSRSAGKGWMGVMRVVFLASALIFIRSLFRLIEFAGNEDSAIQKSEAYLYICDSTLMFGVLAILIYPHPTEYVLSHREFMQAQGEELTEQASARRA